MHKFIIKVGDETAELRLVREYDSRLQLYFYRFVNLDADSLFPEYFSTVARALDWLDATFGEEGWKAW